MARQNQGLQIFLIVFVVLTLGFAVATLMLSSQCKEAKAKAEAGQKVAAEARAANDIIQEENNDLKRLMGFPDTMKLDEINEQFKLDMDNYAGNYSEEGRFYNTVLPYLSKRIEDKLEEIEESEARRQALEDQYAQWKKEEETQLKQFSAAVKQAQDDVAKLTDDFKSQRTKMFSEQAEVRDVLQQSQKKATTTIAAVQKNLQETGAQLKKVTQVKDKIKKQLDEITKETFEVPDGEIRWVNQRNGTVWINLGRDDSLNLQTTFSVYPADMTNLSRAGKKASIEVTHILGPDTAEARVIEDDIADPIMIGDKIHTPVWSPGTKNHFALAGVMDIDGDGKNDQQTVVKLITMSGGVVDCQPSEDGSKLIGAMSIGTRYLVLGKQPDEKSKTGEHAVWSRMDGDAQQLGVKTIQLPELLEKMGWKNQTPVVRFGRDANPADFRAKPAAGVPRVSSGNVSDLFKHRRPPTRTATGRGGVY